MKEDKKSSNALVKRELRLYSW